MFKFSQNVSGSCTLAVWVASLLATVTPGHAQENPKAEPPIAPIAARTKAISDKLEISVPMVFPRETTLADVLTYITQATAGPNEAGIPIYVEPLGLREVQKTLTSTINLHVENASLRVTLPQVLDQVGLAYVVKDGVLIVSSPGGIERARKERPVLARDVTPRTKDVLAKLDERFSMSFSGEPSLDDVLKYVHQATMSATYSGIPIFVDPIGLEEAGCSLETGVPFDLEGVPLATSLCLLLKEHGLACVVRDGVLVVSSTRGVRLRQRTGDVDVPAKDDGGK